MLNTRGIILRAVKYGETSIIADIYTEEKGLLTFIANGVRKAKANIPPALMQVGSLVSLVAYFSEHKEIHRLKELYAETVFHSIPFDIRKMSVLLFIMEICRKTIRDPEGNPDLFCFIYRTMLTLDNNKSGISSLPVRFLVHLCPYLGFEPLGRYSDDLTYFDLREGQFIPSPPPHEFFMDKEESQAFSHFLDLEEGKHSMPALNKAGRIKLLNHLLKFYRLHLESFPEIHSHKILSEVLSS